MSDNRIIDKLLADGYLTQRQLERARENVTSTTGGITLKEVLLEKELITIKDWDEAAAQMEEGNNLAELLANIPTFDDLLDELTFNDVKIFSTVLEAETFADGAALFAEGDAGDKVYIIKSGQVKIVKGADIVVTTLGIGDLLGEMSFVLGWHRTARGIAEGPTEVLAISRKKFLRFCDRFPITGLKIVLGLLKVICFRLRIYESTLGDRGSLQVVPTLKYESDHGLTWNEIFDTLKSGEARAFQKIICERSIAADEVIFQQGNPGECMYAIKVGAVEAFYEDRSGGRTKLAVMEDGYVFGEMAFILGWPRCATLRTLKPTTVVIIDKHGFENFMIEYPGAALKIVLTLAKLISYRMEIYSKLRGG